MAGKMKSQNVEVLVGVNQDQYQAGKVVQGDQDKPDSLGQNQIEWTNQCTQK